AMTGGAGDRATDVAREAEAGAVHRLRAALSERVIPSLVEQARRDAPVPDDALRDMLLRYALRGEREGAIALVTRCVQAGMRPEVLSEDLLGEVARALGRGWEDDACDFVAVTCGVDLLDALLREIRQLAPPRLVPATRPSVLLASAPGEQHVFGLSVLRDAFERAGWEVTRSVGGAAHALLAQVTAQHFDVLALSVATDRHLSTLPALMKSARRLSTNPRLRLIVGGAAILRHPETGTRIGADAIGLDAETALAEASRLLKETWTANDDGKPA
ncbi:MAG: cobalamin B12-binding domain-containing protein, partial [Pseudomonadota bacterium]